MNGPDDAAAHGHPARGRLLLALAAVYLIWGSTYLAIHVAVAEIRPFTLVASRFLLSGALLYAWVRLRGAPRPSPVQWRSAAIAGVLMLTCGNGAVVWGQQRVPSGLAALIVATVPMWMVVFDWLFGSKRLPRPVVLLGVAIGTLGVAVLKLDGGSLGASQIDPVAGLVLLLAPITWSAGSLYSRRAPLPASALETTAMQMLCAGAAAVPFALALEDADPAAIAGWSPRAMASVAYLALLGSIVGLTAYVWLLKRTSPALATSYAYVNPIVAIALGWAVADEHLAKRSIYAAALILAAVVLITLAANRPPGSNAARVAASSSGS